LKKRANLFETTFDYLMLFLNQVLAQALGYLTLLMKTTSLSCLLWTFCRCFVRGIWNLEITNMNTWSVPATKMRPYKDSIFLITLSSSSS